MAFLIVVSCARAVAAAGGLSYAYDSLNRLSRVEYNDGSVIRYTYDAAGNRLSEVVDRAAPSVTIDLPTGASVYTTSAAALDISGTASDDTSVTAVTWSNARGGSGTAVGTPNWTVLGIHLQPGVNVLTVTATDTVGKTAVATLTVTLAVSTPTDMPTQEPTSLPIASNTPTASAVPTNLATEIPTATPTETVVATSTPTGTATRTPTPPTPSPTPTSTSTPILCAGDCDGQNGVTIDEILTLVNMALGNGGTCLSGLAAGVTPDVSVILQAVNNALNGCRK